MFTIGRSIALAILPFIAFVQPVRADDDYVFILKGRGNVFWQVIKRGIEEAGKERNLKPVIYNTDDDQSSEAQLNICQTAIQRHPKIIVMGAATKSVGLACYKMALAAGVLVADIDSNVTLDDAKSAGLELSFTVGSDNYKIGVLAAQELKRQEPEADFTVLVIKGLAGSIVSEKRAQGFLDTLKNEAPAARVVATLSGDWDRMKAMNIVQDTLQRDPGLDAVFSASDVMSMGIVEALRLSKREGLTKLVSVDGIADARKAILDGRMAANVAQLPFLMGRRAVEMAMIAVKGEAPPQSEYIPTPILTKPVLENQANPELKYVR